jgi:hypothetical protein
LRAQWLRAPEPPLLGNALVGVASIDVAIHDELALNRRADCLPSAAAPWFAVDELQALVRYRGAHSTRLAPDRPAGQDTGSRYALLREPRAREVRPHKVRRAGS